MTQEDGPLEIEIGDSGMQPNLLPGVPSGWTDALTGMLQGAATELTFAAFVVEHTRLAAQQILKGEPVVPAALLIRLEDVASRLEAKSRRSRARTCGVSQA